MANPLIFNAAELLRRPGAEKTVDIQATLDDLQLVDDCRFAPDATVLVRLRLESLTDGIVVDGRVSVPWRGTCRRCLAEVSGVVDSEVHDLYQRVITDPEAFEIVGDQLDLGPVVREVVVLDAPSTPLCRDECAGLCQSCGADLNVGDCGCVVDTSDGRWDALTGWRELTPSDE